MSSYHEVIIRTQTIRTCIAGLVQQRQVASGARRKLVVPLPSPETFIREIINSEIPKSIYRHNGAKTRGSSIKPLETGWHAPPLRPPPPLRRLSTVARLEPGQFFEITHHSFQYTSSFTGFVLSSGTKHLPHICHDDSGTEAPTTSD